MDYAQALKQIQAAKKEAKPPYLKVYFAYDKQLVFPYKEGLAFIGALEHAEQLYEEYSRPSNIGDITCSIEISPMTHSEYMAFKLSNLLQITLQEARELHKGEPK